jgi:hypothetical protein
MLVTGKSRQRLGHVAARTQVGAAGALPSRRRRQVLAGAIAGLAILGMSIRVTSCQRDCGPGFSRRQPAMPRHLVPLPSGVAPAQRHWPASPPFLKAGIRRLAAQPGGALQAGPQRISVGGRPALKFRTSGLSYNGTHVESTLIYTFDGRTEYAINCQQTPEHAAQVTRACDQVLRTFTVSS